MTVARFDASASTSPAYAYPRPPHVLSEGIGFRLVRLIWLTARFARRESVTIADYRHRFGVSVRSFYRDITLLRRAGLHIDSAATGSYRMLCFLADADHA
jgi:hypothetical protein